MILKQLISCFSATLTLMVKGKASSTKPPDHDAIFSENKSSYVYIVTSKIKVKTSLKKRYLIQQRDLMHPVSMLEPKKMWNKTLRNQNCEYETKNCKNCKIRDFIDIAKLKNTNNE